MNSPHRHERQNQAEKPGQMGDAPHITPAKEMKV